MRSSHARVHTDTHTRVCGHKRSGAIPRSEPSPGEGISTYLRCLGPTASCGASELPPCSSLPPSAWARCVPRPWEKLQVPVLASHIPAGLDWDAAPSQQTWPQRRSSLDSRGTHVPHLGVISRHVATPHRGFPLLLLPPGLLMCCGSCQTCSGPSDVPQPRSPRV